MDSVWVGIRESYKFIILNTLGIMVTFKAVCMITGQPRLTCQAAWPVTNHQPRDPTHGGAPIHLFLRTELLDTPGHETRLSDSCSTDIFASPVCSGAGFDVRP